MNHRPSATTQGFPPGTGAAPVPGRARARTGWWVPPALLALAFIPIAGGTGRLIEVLGGPEVLPTDARFAASPAPLVVHIVSAVLYAVLGAFQFSARLRRRHPGWHRRTGRLGVQRLLSPENCMLTSSPIDSMPSGQCVSSPVRTQSEGYRPRDQPRIARSLRAGRLPR